MSKEKKRIEYVGVMKGDKKLSTILEKMKRCIEAKISKRILVLVFMTIFIVSLIPIIATTFYTVPTFDDYNFGLMSHASWESGNGFLKGVIKSCEQFYNNWQGFYTSNFMASIQPFNMDLKLYCISNIIVIGGLIFSLFYFAKVLLVNVIGMNKVDYLLVTIPFVGIIIQFIPSAAEGFYWMDGSLAMWINAVVLMIISFVINHYITTSKKRRTLYALGATLGVLSISGSSLLSYVTVMCVLTVLIICFRKKQQSTCILMIILMTLYTLGIIISLLAPGNVNRTNSLEGTSFINAILFAVIYGVLYMGKWATLALIACLCFAAALFYPYARQSSYEFKYPLGIVILCFGLYTARMSVQLFSTGYLGAPRQMNQYFLGFVICVTISVLYFVGWLSKKEIILLPIELSKKMSLGGVVLLLFVFSSGCLGYGITNMISINTTLSFIRGETQQYHAEMMERIEMYEDPMIENVVVEELSVYPDFFCGESLQEDENYWTNRSVTRYYGKTSVKLKLTEDK